MNTIPRNKYIQNETQSDDVVLIGNEAPQFFREKIKG